ncbi:mechanosensitive ion channel family protein [Hymenobacter coccineus]|uniref:Mechanosensitive ion channel MscS domain-containing protein n=1 Tax=Hymenobacter coccineus TaxID=1908235 RepID=A0A1G1THM7_9BACT|nr:mechanosensitive ion channel domain-containing protein [Hymenobacter coccineus]OGX90391.1 hypothetical protein BEN49_06910 [Hymenobacter coccineus]
MLGALIYRLNRFFRTINQRILRWRGSPLRPWRINGYELLTQERQMEVLQMALKLLRVALVVLTLYLALPLLFSRFPWTEGISRKLLGYVLGPVQQVLLGVGHYVPNLLTIFVIYFFTTYAVRFLRFLAGEVAAGELVIEGFYPDWALPTFNLLRFALYVFMFIVIFPYLPGSDSPVFQGGSVLLGFIISFGSTSAIGNVIAGIVITYMRPYKVGDWEKIGDVTGDVLEKNLLVTRLCTIKNEDVTIPNSNILGGAHHQLHGRCWPRGPDSARHRHHWLRRGLAAGARAAAGRRPRHGGRGGHALRAANQPRRLLRGLATQCLHPAAAPPGRAVLAAAPAHPGRVYPRRGRNHVAPLPRHPHRGRGRPHRAARPARWHRHTTVSPAAEYRRKYE